MPEEILDPGQVLIDTYVYDSGVRVLAKYGRALYWRTGAVRAIQINHEFSIKKQDESVEHGAVGDYLVMPLNGGEFFIVSENDFNLNYVQAQGDYYEPPMEGDVTIDGVPYEDGIAAFAKYEAAWYRPGGVVWAMQINEPFTAVYEGVTQAGAPGDYLVGPDGGGGYWVEEQSTFESEWEVAVAPEDIPAGPDYSPDPTPPDESPPEDEWEGSEE